jgi:hypothetical protein
MTIDAAPLAEIATENLKSMTISACGQWVTFVTETGAQINFNSSAVTRVSDDYRRTYGPRDGAAVTFALQRTV